MHQKPKLIVFDLYGTLIRYGIRINPLKRILQSSKEQGREPCRDDLRKLMTTNKPIDALLADMNIFLPDSDLHLLQSELDQEIRGLQLFDDVVPALQLICDAGCAMAVCSNLAFPYGAVLDRLLPDFEFTRCLSYEVGAIKPEFEMYQSIVDMTQIGARDTIFVGDKKLEDCNGPNSFGFRGFQLVRGRPATTPLSLSSLDQLAPLCS